MFVSDLSIKNFRCFADLELGGFNVPNGQPASGLNVLIGENGNGKTTFLEALNLLTQSSYTAGNMLDVADLTDMAAELQITYTSSASFRCKMPATYRGAHFEANGVGFRAKVRDKKSSGRLLSSPIKASASFRSVGTQYTNSKGEAVGQIPPLALVFHDDTIVGDGLNIVYFDKNRSRHLTHGTYKTTFERICDDLDWRFVKALNGDPEKRQTLVRSLSGDFFEQARDTAQSGVGQKVADELSAFFDDERYKSLRLDLANYLRPFANGLLALRKEGSLTQIMAKDLGSGIEIVMALLMLKGISGASKGKIIYLIDEPEAHLHPKAQKQLLRLLVEEARDKQVFVSTHSPYIFKDAFPTQPGMFIFRRDPNDEIEIVDTNQAGFGHFPWSPSWGEVNFSAYDLATVELHNELYGFVQEKTDNWSEQSIESYFAAKGVALEKVWIRATGGDVQPPSQVTLFTYVRNAIHHPENTHNDVPTDEELRRSVEGMMALVEAGI